jgi:hypothetical protein
MRRNPRGRIARGVELGSGEKDRLVKRTITIIACLVAIGMFAQRVRADAIPISASGLPNLQVTPLGFWTYGKRPLPLVLSWAAGL